MKIGFGTPNTPSWEKAVSLVREQLASCGDFELVHGEPECLDQIADIDVLVSHRLSLAAAEKALRLKALFVPIVGLNQLPLACLQARQVAVFNCHGNAFSVAERALALALAGFGRIVEYHNDLSRELWHGFWIGRGKEDFWHSIQGYACTILGTGAIGQRLASFLKAFECPVTGFRRQTAAEAVPGFDRVTADLPTALSGAEIVFVALPLTEATRGLIGGRELACMKGAFLVNVGRAEIVDEAALYAALWQGQLAGAGLDVWYQYPAAGTDSIAPSRYPIHKLPNVVLSPHVAGSTFEAAELNISQTVQNLVTYLRTGSARHRVDLEAQY